jgi:hypothetical protein
MPNEVALKIYPRGFLGRVLDTQLKLQPRPFEARLNALAVKVNIFTPQVNSVDANPIVESLYGQWINRAPETTSFEFRKKVMIAALSAFGTDSFYDWFSAQMLSPAFGDMHRRFLDDTLVFLQTGRREMFLETWTSLVTVRDSGERIEEFNQHEREFFGIKDPEAQYREPMNRQLVDVIQCWVSHPTGFNDLVGSLHLLFGNLT